MKTLDELLTAAAEAQKGYETQKAAAEKSYHEAVAARDKAKEEAAKAAASGDREAYTKACQDEAFANERAKALWNVSVSPYFSEEQHNHFIDEVNQATRNATRPLFKRLWELFDEWFNVVSQIKATANKANRIDLTLVRSRPTEKSGNSFQKYNRVMGFGLPSVLDIPKPKEDTMRHALEWFYNPEKEKNGNV